MPQAAKCPNCGAPLSEASVIALAPVCEHCKTVIIEAGGTLGLTGVYGLNDPNITRKRVEADLGVLHESASRYRGMRISCEQQLDWERERYANLPPQPALLPVKEVHIGTALFSGIGRLIAWLIIGAIGIAFLDAIVEIVTLGGRTRPLLDSELVGRAYLGIGLVLLLVPVFRQIDAIMENGDRPARNAALQADHEAAVRRELQEAEERKLAADHRLRVQIRELEALERTVAQRAAQVEEVYRKLHAEK